MWPFGGAKDWNIVGIMFEKPDSYSINANRAKGKMAESVRNRVRIHERTILWVVYDQKGSIIESGNGNGHHYVSPEIIKKLQQILHTNMSIREILQMLEKGQTDKAARKLIWGGYPQATRKEED